MTLANETSELRQAFRLIRQPDHSWQLRLEDDRLITKNIINLSATGMAFKAPHSAVFSPGQTVRFSLSIEPGTSFECEGRVMWARPSVSGSMRQIGIQFSSLPVSLDTAIVKQIHDFALRHQRERLGKGRRPLSQKIVESAPPTLRNLILKSIAATLIMALTSAFIAALWLHKQAHPEQSIAHKFNQGMMRKLSSSPER